MSTPDGMFDADSAKTTTGEGKPPPLVEELKEAVRGGVQLGRANSGTSSTTIASMNKLNPSAPEFTPLSRTSPTTTTMSHPIYTKHSIPTTTSSKLLDPDSKEFVPGITPPIINGNPDLYGNGDVIPEEEFEDYLDIKTIVRGFERAAPTIPDDSSDLILKGAAEILLKVYNYPASFNELGDRKSVV